MKEYVLREALTTIDNGHLWMDFYSSTFPSEQPA